VRGELELKDNAIASLETKLSGVVSELEARDDAIANLKPTPTPEPEPEPEPTDTVDRSGLLEFINKNFPDDKIKPKQITNAVYRNGVGLSKLESKYGFKFVGTSENGNQFKLI